MTTISTSPTSSSPGRVDHRLSFRGTGRSVVGTCDCGATFRPAGTRPPSVPRRARIRDAHGTHLLSSINHALDLRVACACGASTGQDCRGLASGIVHSGRRIRRLLAGIPLAKHAGQISRRVDP